MKVKYRLVYCRNGVFRGDGRAQVTVEAAQRGRRKYFGSNVYVLKEQWDRKKEQIVRHPNGDALNAYLLEMVINLERVELDLWKKGITPTLNLIKEGYGSENLPQESFESFGMQNVAMSSRREGTKKNLISTLKCLSMYRGGALWADINYTFVLQFEAWLNGQGYARNTVIKHLRNLRTLINEAIACGYIHSENNPFKNFKIPAQMSRHKFLSHEDLNRLETMRLEGRLKHIRDAFLFCCYTGLRFSDFCLLRTEMFVHEGGYLWLKMSLKKTSTQVCIPLNCLFDGKGVEILEGYDSVETFARIGSNSKVNAALKNIQRKAGIITHLTFHLARHTCATLLCYQGVPITTIQKILGHSRIGTTQIYQEVLTETMIKDLMSAR